MSYNDLNYFIPSTKIAKTVDYRGGLVRDFVRKWQQKLTEISGDILTNIVPLYGSSREGAFAAEFDAIQRLCAAPANWSSSAATTPNAQQSLEAQHGLIRLFLAGVPAPKVMPLDEGTLGAFWRSGNNYASIDFDVDGIYPWAAAKDTDVVSGNWHDETLPQALRDIIST